MVLLASEFDKSKYLRADDLKEAAKFRIREVTAEWIGIGADKEQKLIVWFSNDDRGLVLNKTNNRALRGAFGDDVELWAAKIIVIFPAMADFRGKMTPCLRVRIPPPKEALAGAAPPRPGNGAAAAPPPKAAVTDPDLDPDPPDHPAKPVMPEYEDEIPF
jgi:hypothetical protein